MIWLVLVFALNAVLAVLPPYGTWNVVNGVCAVVALGAMVLESRQ